MTTVLSSADLYHTGIVVPEVDMAANRLTEIAGYNWTKPIAIELPMWVAGHKQTLAFHLVYSLQAPHIELVQQIPGTPWIPAQDSAVHHLGYFCDDLVGLGANLERAGFSCESHAIVDGAMALFAYYLDSAGMRIEVVDRAVFGDWPTFLRDNAAETSTSSKTHVSVPPYQGLSEQGGSDLGLTRRA